VGFAVVQLKPATRGCLKRQRGRAAQHLAPALGDFPASKQFLSAATTAAFLRQVSGVTKVLKAQRRRTKRAK
jgi:hypothetical protein